MYDIIRNVVLLISILISFVIANKFNTRARPKYALIRIRKSFPYLHPGSENTSRIALEDSNLLIADPVPFESDINGNDYLSIHSTLQYDLQSPYLLQPHWCSWMGDDVYDIKPLPPYSNSSLLGARHLLY